MFHTLSRMFVYRWHLTMQSMKTWPKVSKYRRRSQKLYPIKCGHDGHVYKTNIRMCIHSFYTQGLGSEEEEEVSLRIEKVIKKSPYQS